MRSPLDDYRIAEDYVNRLITGSPSPPPGTPRELIHQRAAERLDRLRAFLHFVGNPQCKFRSIHIAGTSGKGSTTVFSASILSEHGYRVGSHVSPYLQVATEKLQIDGAIIPANRYRILVESMRERVDTWVASGHERLTYGEFWVAMTFQYFAEEEVDAAVVEVGAGGRFDLTNVIAPDVVVITSVGYDHMVTLGSTLPEIAWHKAGVIKPGILALSAVTDPEAVPVIEEEARIRSAQLKNVWPGEAYDAVRTDASGTSFIDTRSGRRFSVALPGSFQASNAAVAIAASRAFDPTIDDRAIEFGLAAARFPGRMEVVQERPTVLLDGAHNPEKIASLARNLDILFPSRRIVLVFGVLESKSYRQMFEVLRPYVAHLIATEPKVLAKPSVTAQEIADLVSDGLPVECVNDPLDAVELALQMSMPDDLVLVTGSLYLVGNVRERWYPTESILAQGTCWPVTSA